MGEAFSGGELASSTDVEVVLGQHPRQREGYGVMRPQRHPSKRISMDTSRGRELT